MITLKKTGDNFFTPPDFALFVAACGEIIGYETVRLSVPRAEKEKIHEKQREIHPARRKRH